jgi:hypothetical protein
MAAMLVVPAHGVVSSQGGSAKNATGFAKTSEVATSFAKLS